MTMNLNPVTECDLGLPRPDELTPLSQGLIPQELACAFNISYSSASICTVATPSSSDVLNASQSAFESLLCMRSVLLPSLESDQKGEAKAGNPTLPGTDVQNSVAAGITKVFKDSNRNLECPRAAEVGIGGGVILRAGAFLSSSLGHDDGSALGHGVSPVSNGLLGYIASSHTHVPESSGADTTVPRASPEDGRGGCGSVVEAAKLMQLKLDPREELDSGSSIDPFQGSAVAMSSEEQSARTLKKPRLVWTPQLHRRFVDAVAQLGIKNAVPKTIMQLMNVDGLTRENVASHLQKYRLYLTRMQGLSAEGPSSPEHLFASTPVPPSLAASAHFLVSHHNLQHSNHRFASVPSTNLSSMLGHSALHLPSHISTSNTPAFAGFDTCAAFSTLARAPSLSLISSDRMRENYSQHSSTPPSRMLTLFPTSGG